MDLKSEIQERDDLIQFLRQQLIKATGKEAEVPYKWEKYRGPAIAPKFNIAKEESKTFAQAIKDLDLPAPAPEPKKGEPLPVIDPDYEKVSLTHYFGQGVTKDAFLTLTGGLKRLTKINILDLSRNNLNDTFVPELEEIFKINKIVRLNLSNNELGKAFLLKFTDIIKSGGTHLEYLDLSGNLFSSETATINGLLTSLKRLSKLHYFSISVQGTGADSFYKGVTQIKNIVNLGLPQSKISPPGPTDSKSKPIKLSEHILRSFEHLTSLNLSQCYLDSPVIVVISETLKHNRTLTKLDLSYNNISWKIGRFLAQALRLNVSLTILNLGNNDLNDEFCHILSNEIRTNQTLFEVNMANNPFTAAGADALQSLIGSTAISSFGNLDDNKNLSVAAREALKGNLGESKNEYKLLAPIEETNPYGEFVVLPWNLTNAVG